MIDLVREYLESWKPEEVARLPAGAWPVPMATSKELIRETLKVGHAHSLFAGNRPSLALLQELLLFMTQASVRATQLAPLPGETHGVQRPVGGKVLTEEERKLFEAPQPAQRPAKPIEDGD